MKRNLTLLGLSVLFIHFTLILIFCFSQFFNPRVVGVATKYVFPLFNQNWRMFAPEPPLSSYKIYYRCRFETDRFSEWINPGKELLLQHQQNRFWNYGKQFNIYESIHRELKYIDTRVSYELDSARCYLPERISRRNQLIIASGQYKLAKKYFTEQSACVFPGRKIKQIDFMYVSATLSGINHKAGEKIYEVITFPIIDFESTTK